MKLLEAVKFHGLFRLWNVDGEEVTEALFFSEILKSIVDNGNDWDPGVFDWSHEEEIDFADWQEIEVEVLPMVMIE
ncbi:MULTISPECIES: hypothetical protein [Bacillaceae]|uniref:Uncharacterized protein n=1 Tax=Domibacillus aminovorans TaxID=29332 RepID=A0A177KXD8_9BACI|nr:MULTISPECIES: hypothetical protein [Bacillaceae]OAH57993.1 hypothetical protein AWH48_03025 [Domibacillus aminovorans]